MSVRNSRAVAVALVTFATFTDIVAYSVAVPVLPDLSRRLGASPTMIGFLFASFGVTLLTVSIPMGAVSDRMGRKAPLVVVLRSPPVAICAAVVIAVSATISMLEPVLPLFLEGTLGLGPARVGLLFGSGAVASTILHPMYGRLADRWGGRRLMMIGL